VSFVVGSFVLADSLRATFTNLFAEINENIDLQVRSSIAFGDESVAERDPIPLTLADDVAAVEGVAVVEPVLQRYAQFLRDADGTAVTTQGAPLLGITWSGNPDAGLTLREGRPAAGPGEVAMDKATADREGFSVGDRVEILTDTGRHEFEIVGLIGLADADGFAGATLAVFDLETGLDVLGAGDRVDTIELQVVDGVEIAVGAGADRGDAARPHRGGHGRPGRRRGGRGHQPVHRPVRDGLLIFAFVTAFVSAFIINNVFAITIGQRLRELALLRAVGASGRQVRRMISFEALVMSLIATTLGIVRRDRLRPADGRAVQRRRFRLPRDRHGAPGAHRRDGVRGRASASRCCR
jgi:putative ABC transport system permease protein